jgi:hypothetical protein
VAEVEKGPPDKLIDWLSSWKASFDRLRNQFGVAVAVLLVLLCVGALTWWNWDDISKKLGVVDIVSWLTQQRVPKARPGHFTIALTNLEEDKDRRFEKLIEDEISHSTETDLLKIDRTIINHEFPEEHQSYEYAVASAKDLLIKSGCDIVLWGTVIEVNDKSAIRLNWTMASNIELPKQSEKYEVNSVSLPPLFHDDMKNLIRLILQSRQKPSIEAGSCSIAVTGNTGNNTVTCNFGLTQEQLKRVTDAAVNGPTEALQDHIDKISKTLGVTEDAAKTLSRSSATTRTFPKTSWMKR